MNNPIRTVLVHGANGVQGGAIARRLCKEGFLVRGSVRNPQKAGALTAEGIEVVPADLESSAALNAANRGVDAVVLTLPLDWNRDTLLRWTENALEAARDARVRLLVFNSGTRVPAEPSDVPSFELRRAAEASIRRYGLPSIVLRPPLFMENLKNPWIAGGIAREGVVAYPTPESFQISWLAADDLGGYVAAALRRSDLAGSTFDVGGPEPLDGPGLARELSAGVGRPLRFVRIPTNSFEHGLTAQFGADVAHGIAATYHFCDRFPDTALLSGAAAILRESLSRPPIRMATWAAAQAWS